MQEQSLNTHSNHSLGRRSRETELLSTEKVAHFCEHTHPMSKQRGADMSDNTQIKVGRSERQASRMICLRKFNNWVKAVQIGKAAHYWQRGRKSSVLDIGCGKGGDMDKWRKVKAHQYIGIGRYTAGLAVEFR